MPRRARANRTPTKWKYKNMIGETHNTDCWLRTMRNNPIFLLWSRNWSALDQLFISLFFFGPERTKSILERIYKIFLWDRKMIFFCYVFLLVRIHLISVARGQSDSCTSNKINRLKFNSITAAKPSSASWISAPKLVQCSEVALGTKVRMQRGSSGEYLAQFDSAARRDRAHRVHDMQAVSAIPRYSTCILHRYADFLIIGRRAALRFSTRTSPLRWNFAMFHLYRCTFNRPASSLLMTLPSRLESQLTRRRETFALSARWLFWANRMPSVPKKALQINDLPETLKLSAS